MAFKQRLRKYLIMGSQNGTRSPVDILTEAIAGGITVFQFREKGKDALTGQAKFDLARQLREICQQNNVLFIVNDDVDLVDPLNADGIHVGQDDTPVKEVRARFPNKVIGLSVSNQQEVRQSPLDLVDYLGAGPVFATTTKPDAKQPVGTDWIKTLRTSLPHLPLVGIGGITVENAHSVIEAGADGVSVISAITEAEHIQAAVRQL